MSHGKTNSVKRILAILTLSAALATPAWSRSIDGKSEWDSLSQEYQVGYVMGIFDEMTTITSSDSIAQQTLKNKIAKCIKDGGVTGQGLVAAINWTYDNKSWRTGYSAQEILRGAIKEYCN